MLVIGCISATEFSLSPRVWGVERLRKINMIIELFSDTPVQEYYEGTVAQQGERRVFNLPVEDLCAGGVKGHVDRIVTMLCPGRLMLNPEVQISTPDAGAGDKILLRQWLEFTGSVRLLRLRPRQYFTTPPRVVRIHPPSGGDSGRLIIEKLVPSLSEYQEIAAYAAEQFRMVKEYFVWVNDDLDYYEHSMRSWLWTLLQAKYKRVCREVTDEADVYLEVVGETKSESDER